MNGVAWWVPWALAFIAVVGTAAAGVLVVLAVRGVWRLVAAYRRTPAHAGGPVGERFWPWDTDPRFGSMQLEDDRQARVDWAMAAWQPPTVPPLDWREVAHEEPWLAQTRADLSPAALDSGPGGPSLAPGPDWPPPWFGAIESDRPDTEPEPGFTLAGRLIETSGEWLRRLERDAGPGWTYAGTAAA